MKSVTRDTCFCTSGGGVVCACSNSCRWEASVATAKRPPVGLIHINIDGGALIHNSIDGGGQMHVTV
jgi:hypothetical protein